MDTSSVKLSHVVLHEPLFLPNAKTGKGINLKNTISVDSIEGKSLGLQLTLLGDKVLIQTKECKGLIPFTGFKLVVPAE